MKITSIDHDINVLYVTAYSFPDGIQAAFDRLRGLAPDITDRQLFGLSRPEHGTIVYHAAATEQYAGEAGALHCQRMTLKKGQYYTLTIKDFMQNLPAIGAAFTEILKQPDIDPDGYCVEWYGKDVQCMVRIQDK